MLDSDMVIAKKIASSLLTYMFSHGVDDVSLRIAQKEDVLTVVAEGKTDSKPDDIEELNKLLNKDRLDSVDGFYGNMLGLNDNLNNIGLLGAMVDDGLIAYDENGLLSFYANRYKKRKRK